MKRGASRWAAETDDNQTEIVAGLRAVGASVQLLHRVGQGCPDLLVGFRGDNYLLEVKDGSKPLSKRALTLAEVDWHYNWRGHVRVVESVEMALQVIGATT